MKNTETNKNMAQLHTVQEAAKFLRCSVACLNRWRVVGGGPKFLKLGRRVLYRNEHLMEFLRENEKTSTSEYSKNYRRKPCGK